MGDTSLVVAILSAQVTRATASGSVAWTFKNASWLNDFRFISAWTWTIPQYTPYAGRYDANPLLYISGFLGAIGLCIAVAFAKGKQAILVLFLLVVVLAALVITKGLHAPFAFINEELYKIPGLVLLIEPAGAAFVAMFCTAIAMGAGLDIGLDFSEASLGFRAHLPRSRCRCADSARVVTIVDGRVFFARRQPLDVCIASLLLARRGCLR